MAVVGSTVAHVVCNGSGDAPGRVLGGSTTNARSDSRRIDDALALATEKLNCTRILDSAPWLSCVCADLMWTMVRRKSERVRGRENEEKEATSTRVCEWEVSRRGLGADGREPRARCRDTSGARQAVLALVVGKKEIKPGISRVVIGRKFFSAAASPSRSLPEATPRALLLPGGGWQPLCGLRL
jgi:hypothetical protein